MKSCQKKCYDLKTAKTVLNERKEKGKKWSREKRIYFCEECQAHHLTSEEEHSERVYLKEEDLIFCRLWEKLKQ